MKIFRSDARKISPSKRMFVNILKSLGFKGVAISKITGVPVSTVYRYLSK